MDIPRGIVQNSLVLIGSLTGIIILIIALSMPIMGMFALGPILSPGGIFGSGYAATGYIDSTITVVGIDSEVTIIRDSWGVPHIYGSSHRDVAYALGYVHAQDRLFQMEMTARTAMGRMSEIMGESELESDIWFRKLGFVKTAQEMVNNYLADPDLSEAIGILDAYCAGVNYKIDYCIKTCTLPIEFKLLGIEPEHWSPLKTFIYNRLMSLMLTYSTTDLDMTLLRDDIFDGDTVVMEELFPLNQTVYQVPVIPGYGNYTIPPSSIKTANNGNNAELVDNPGLKTAITNILDSTPEYVKYYLQSWVGSNNWVVDGNKSATGKPILANDMHLSIDLPHIWYEAHLVSPSDGLNVYGYTLTGTPVVIVGYNQHIAWGITNVGNDAVDWYQYLWNADETQYWNGTTWLTPESRTENILIKGEGNYTETIRYTVDGVIMGDMMGMNSLAMRWTATVSPTHEIKAFLGVNKARNWGEFNNSMLYFEDPTSNIVFADVDGTISLRPTGRFIKRRYFGEGRFVMNGSDPSVNKTWEYIPYNELPLSLNPDQHYLASANQRSTGSDYQYFISSDQDTGYRGRSINRWLSQAPDSSVTVDFMKDAQCGSKGIYDICAESFTPFFIDAISGLATSGINADALAALESWNNSADRYLMRTDLVGPVIFQETMDNFRQLVWADEWAETTSSKKPGDAILEYIVREEPDSSWFDIETTGAVEDRDDIIVQAFNLAITDLGAEFGNELTNWTWGSYHTMQYDHLTGISAFSRGPYPHNGSRYSLLAASGRPVTSGPSERMVIDFSNASNGWSVLPTGQSGNAVNPHYDNQMDLWLAGQYHPMLVPLTIESFPSSYVIATLVLKPRS